MKEKFVFKNFSSLKYFLEYKFSREIHENLYISFIMKNLSRISWMKYFFYALITYSRLQSIESQYRKMETTGGKQIRTFTFSIHYLPLSTHSIALYCQNLIDFYINKRTRMDPAHTRANTKLKSFFLKKILF